MKQTIQNLAIIDVAELDKQIEALEKDIEVIETRADVHEEWDRAICYGKLSVLRNFKSKLIPAEKLADAAFYAGRNSNSYDDNLTMIENMEAWKREKQDFLNSEINL